MIGWQTHDPSFCADGTYEGPLSFLPSLCALIVIAKKEEEEVTAAE